jgi:hypothetical protein
MLNIKIGGEKKRIYFSSLLKKEKPKRKIILSVLFQLAILKAKLEKF